MKAQGRPVHFKIRGSMGGGVVASNMVEIRRCQHIKVNGTQCGSPARRKERFCHYHRENQPERVQVADEKGQASGEVLMPVLEDAQSIQSVVRQVAMLILGGKIDNKKAGLMLYAMQIASSNLKRIEAEKPRATQVVVDPKRVGETPMGMTPWSGNEEGHEPEELEDKRIARTKREILEEAENRKRERERIWLSRELGEVRDELSRRSEEIRKWIGNEPPVKPEKMRWELARLNAGIGSIAKAIKGHRLLSELIYDRSWDYVGSTGSEAEAEKAMLERLAKGACAAGR